MCVFVQQIFVRQILNASLCWTNQTSTSANLLLSMLWLGIAASNSVTRKTTRLAFVTYNLTSSKLHRHKIIKNDDMGVNIRVPRLMRPCRDFSHRLEPGAARLFKKQSNGSKLRKLLKIIILSKFQEKYNPGLF